MVNYALYIYELPLQLFKIFVLGDLFFVVGVITCLIYLNHNKINVLYHFSLDTYFIIECNWMLLFSDKFVDRLVYYFIFVWTYFSYLCFLIPGLLICLCFAFLNCIYLFTYTLKPDTFPRLKLTSFYSFLSNRTEPYIYLLSKTPLSSSTQYNLTKMNIFVTIVMPFPPR